VPMARVLASRARRSGLADRLDFGAASREGIALHVGSPECGGGRVPVGAGRGF
jgi:hypothetical protein